MTVLARTMPTERQRQHVKKLLNRKAALDKDEEFASEKLRFCLGHIDAIEVTVQLSMGPIASASTSGGGYGMRSSPRASLLGQDILVSHSL